MEARENEAEGRGDLRVGFSSCSNLGSIPQALLHPCPWVLQDTWVSCQEMSELVSESKKARRRHYYRSLEDNWFTEWLPPSPWPNTQHKPTLLQFACYVLDPELEGFEWHRDEGPRAEGEHCQCTWGSALTNTWRVCWGNAAVTRRGKRRSWGGGGGYWRVATRKHH